MNSVFKFMALAICSAALGLSASAVWAQTHQHAHPLGQSKASTRAQCCHSTKKPGRMLCSTAYALLLICSPPLTAALARLLLRCCTKRCNSAKTNPN